MPGKSGGNPHPALLPIFLLMSQNGRELEKSLDELANFIQSARSALEAMRNGMEAFQAGMMKIAPPAGPPGNSPKQKDTVSTRPVKETIPKAENEAAVNSPHKAAE